MDISQLPYPLSKISMNSFLMEEFEDENINFEDFKSNMEALKSRSELCHSVEFVKKSNILLYDNLENETTNDVSSSFNTMSFSTIHTKTKRINMTGR